MRFHIFLGAALMFAVGAGAQAQDYTVSSIVTNSKDKHLANPWACRTFRRITGLQSMVGGRQRQRLLDVVLREGPKGRIDHTHSPASGSGRVARPELPTIRSGGVCLRDLGWHLVRVERLRRAGQAGQRLLSMPRERCDHCREQLASGASYQGLTTATKGSTGALTYYAANASGAVEPMTQRPSPGLNCRRTPSQTP